MTIKQKQNLRLGNLFKTSRTGRMPRKSWWPVINAVIYVFIFMGGAYFIAGINDLSIKGFMLRELKAEAAGLERENRELELSVMRFESYDDLSRRARESMMVKVDKIDYIAVFNGEVAKR